MWLVSSFVNCTRKDNLSSSSHAITSFQHMKYFRNIPNLQLCPKVDMIEGSRKHPN